MSYYIVVFDDGSFKIYKNKQDKSRLPQGARLFICSSNVTVQDLHMWVAKGFQGLQSIREIEG